MEELLCCAISTFLFYCFLNVVTWVSNSETRSVAANKIIARVVAYVLCAICIVIPHVLNDVVKEPISGFVSLLSVALCNIIVGCLNRFIQKDSLGSNFVYYIHGFILALAVFCATASAWTTALTILIQFLEFYVSYDFKNKNKKKKNCQQKRKKILKQVFLTLINCVIVLLLLVVFPTIDSYVEKHKIAIFLPWVILSVYHIVKILSLKPKRQNPTSD